MSLFVSLSSPFEGGILATSVGVFMLGCFCLPFIVYGIAFAREKGEFNYLMPKQKLDKTSFESVVDFLSLCLWCFFSFFLATTKVPSFYGNSP